MPSVTKNFVPVLARVALAGCGGGSGGQGGAKDEDAVRSVVADLQAASRAGDGNQICNQIFTPKLADSVTSASKSGSCAKEVKKNLFSPQVRIVVEDVEVADPANATATVKEKTGKTSNVSFV